MKNKIILTQIVKNESHVIRRMLDSLKNFIDGVVIVDTGSTDDTETKIQQFSEDTGIPCYVIHRKFDTFENSRNESLLQARYFFPDDNETTHFGFWLDADEQLKIDKSFKKQDLKADLYMVRTRLNGMSYTRNELYKLHKPFRFYGPVHEYLTIDEPITAEIAKGIEVLVLSDGASWSQDIHEKYKAHAEILEKYTVENPQDPRWLFYLAQSYNDAACSKNEMTNTAMIGKAIGAYKDRVIRKDGHFEERYYSQMRIGLLMQRYGHKWEEVKSTLMAAYSMDPFRAEPIKAVIDHYLKERNIPMAYIYSKFAYTQFHGKVPNRTLFLETELYNWKLLEVYAATLKYMGYDKEALQLYTKLVALTKSKSQWFTPTDKERIANNRKFFFTKPQK